jgi:hypothetical protein
LTIDVAVPGSNEQMEKLSDSGPAYFKGMKGFKSAVFFSDKARNEYGLMTIWQTKDNYDAFMKAYLADPKPRPWFAGTLFEERTFFVNNFFTSA